MHFNILRQSGRFVYAYFNIYFYLPNFASIGRVDLVSKLLQGLLEQRERKYIFLNVKNVVYSLVSHANLVKFFSLKFHLIHHHQNIDMPIAIGMIQTIK